MPHDQLHALITAIATVIELAGVAVILGGIVLAAWVFVAAGRRSGTWRAAYEGFRANLGRGILLGLELLVAADIIRTVSAPLTGTSVGLLAAVIAIRTFLSFALETEIEGRWPWRRAEGRRDGEGGTR